MMKQTVLTLMMCVALVLAASSAQGKAVNGNATSPDGRIVLTYSTNAAGQLQYTVAKDGAVAEMDADARPDRA